jgi:LysR family hydrogen peroxide-inducible transcriptional activator
VETNQLRYFVAAAECASFAKAAADCHTSPANLSEQIKKLEDRLGKPLLNRSRRRVVTTPAGQKFMVRAKDILSRVELAESELRMEGDVLGGKITLGILPTIAPYFLPRVLGSFLEVYPQGKVCIHETTTKHALELIGAGHLDLAVVCQPIRLHGFEVENLLHEELLLGMPARHPFAQKREIFPDDLRSEKFILLEEDHCLAGQFVDFCHRQDFQPRIVFRCGQLATVQALVADGLGISLFPQMAVPEIPTAVIYRSLANPQPQRAVAVVSRSHRQLKLGAREFLKHLRSAAQLSPAPKNK